MSEHLYLKFLPRELDYIAQCLTKQPWSEVNALLVSIQQQVNQQQQEQRHANGNDGVGEPAKLASISGSG